MEEAPLNVTFWNKFVFQRLLNLLELNFHQAYTDFMNWVNPYVTDCKNGSSITARCYADNNCYTLAFTIGEYDKCVKHVWRSCYVYNTRPQTLG